MDLLARARVKLREARLDAYPVLFSEASRLGVYVPMIVGITSIKVRGIPRWGMYEPELGRILVNLGKIREALALGWSQSSIKQAVVETIFHEFYHHYQFTRKGLTIEEYLRNPEPYEAEAENYARTILATRFRR
jgi:hypothetical protein